jgi:hypothetical protein
MYTPFAQLPPHLASRLVDVLPLRWLVRTTADSFRFENQLASAVLDIDAQQPIAEVRTMRQVFAEAVNRWRFKILLGFLPSPSSSRPSASSVSSPARSASAPARLAFGWLSVHSAPQFSGWSFASAGFCLHAAFLSDWRESP